MTVEILYFAELKEITKKATETFTLANNDLKELLFLLFEKYHIFKTILWNEASENLKSNISIAINDVIVQIDNKLSLSLSDGDKIAFLLPMSGG